MMFMTLNIENSTLDVESLIANDKTHKTSGLVKLLTHSSISYFREMNSLCITMYDTDSNKALVDYIRQDVT